MNRQIDVDRLREIINEELSNICEQVDHAGVRTVVNSASKLLAAIETYKKSATAAMDNAIGGALSTIERQLEDMISAPGSYVDRPKAEPKKVSLRPVK